ncbi:MAG: large conductance mechanosensitive channel protein MscL [Erysipelothrix sp.]|nr:large conductance mechanosensitive channel protein MscL [Erysipelothrix sp.]
MLNEFKAFISRGSAMELAIGVIMGSTFSAIITSLVNDVMMPFVGMFIGVDFTSLTITFNDSTILIGNFLQAVVNFVIVGFILFLIVKVMNKLSKPAVEEEVVVVEAEELTLLREIRDSLKNK